MKKYILKVNSEDNEMVEMYLHRKSKSPWFLAAIPIDAIPQHSRELEEHGQIYVEMIFAGER